MNERIIEIEKDLQSKPLTQRNNPFRTVAIYFLFGFLWILFSDKILASVVTDPATYQTIQTYKGWIYVTLTSVGLFFIIRLDYREIFGLNRDISDRSQQLLTYNEELIAMEEELNQKISVLYETTEALDEQKKYVYEIYNSSNAIIMVWNLNGELIDVNEQFVELLGYEMDDIIGKNWMSFLILPSEEHIIKEMIERLKISHRVSNVENKVVKFDGEVLDILWNDALIQNPISGEVNVVSFGVDITRQREAEKEMLKLAYVDALTELQNSVVFEAHLQRYVKMNMTFAIYYIDIDDFKRLNDIHGHQKGNVFLKKYGQTLLRHFPTLEVFRWCEDEFLLIEKNISEDIRDRRTNEIKMMTQREWLIDDVSFTPSISIGTTFFPNDGDDAETLMMTMDMALYKAKSIGKGKVVHYENRLQKEVEYTIRVETAIEQALKNDSFELFYQPIYAIKTKEIVSVEILLRWQNNPFNISTQDFIDVAEHTGHIVRIDTWVIEHAFAYVSEQTIDTFPYIVAINLSVQSFKSEHLMSFLDKMIKKYGIDPTRFEFEVTEYSFIEDFEMAKKAVMRLKDFGFRISLDDFGTRFSSINYLVQMPFDQLKLDKSYIDQIVSSQSHCTVVEHIIELSHDLGLKIVAEGIEYAGQFEKLSSMKCDFGQGYLMAYPSPLVDFDSEKHIFSS